MPLNIAETADVTAALTEAKAYADSLVLTGPEGPAGADGAQGEQGPAGPQGVPGVDGAPGPAGVDGAQGPQGETGPQGPQGPAGADGVQGPQGVIGPVGPTGGVGATGAPGAAGSPGAQGAQGAPGATGATGPAGPQGPQGDVGPQGPAGTGSAYVYETEVPLGVRTESTDDGKLAALRAIMAADTFKGVPIVLDKKKTYTFSQQVQAYNGMSIVSGGRRAVDQARSSKPIPNQVNIRTTGPWITLPAGDIFGMYFQGLSLDGTNSNSFMGGSGVVWTSVFRDISAQNFGDLFGTVGTKFLNTASSFEGFWNINNIQNTGWNLGGSDSRMNFTQCLIDSPAADLMLDSEYLLRFSQQSKTYVTGLYITAERHAGILNSGSNDTVFLRGITVEGRNAGAPALGCLIRNESNGELSITDSWLSYAMSAPTSGSLGRTDRGVVHVTSGRCLISNVEYERASGVAESVPFAFFGSTARGRVRDIFGKGFSGKPVVQVLKAAGESDTTAAGRVVCDDSVTVSFVTV